ncbi:phosphatase PAP2 family protein [Corynebacterium macginleyi]|uniref:phosphatase PAP2 family protein n=1 Tax=Corynebacterium macginleyi TaxID=38290 RepID=UPI00190C8C4D|nr:phosphatase PAP2 family protein [Corynebacterium macginleyi]MBK4148686.1 phosphatase PAP2 family protein [Corynebacterium macginleyi]MBK4158916.1 phosphatase PAP2 family protein [Corynebacterium macginleyi]MBK4178082.1 phosphatase PAP2 family protein [Corynebacterium macginleyi]
MPNKLSIAESRVLESIQNAAFDVPGILPTARGLSHLGEHALGWMGIAALGASLDKQRREEWVRIGAAAFTAHAASVVLKRIVRRKRPDYSYVRVGVKTPSRLSFPSSHATSTTAFLVGLSRLTGSRAPLVGVPVMMSSRMVLGVHYPTDTVAGAVIGAAAAWATTKEKKHE